MANPLLAFVQKHAGPDLVPRLKQQALGLAADFWKDTPAQFPAIELKLAGRALKIPNFLKPQPASDQPAAAPAAAAAPLLKPEIQKAAATAAAPASAPGQWHALPGEVAEKMWGDGYILPAGDQVLDMLIAPLGLTRDKVILDLSAGLGGHLRYVSARLSQIKGCEVDAAIAARGMELSTKAGKAKQAPVEVYDPTSFSMPAIYDAVLAREVFYRITDKPSFLYRVGAGVKLRGQAAFADYIVDTTDHDKPAIKACMEFEKNAKPLSLAEMNEAWVKVGFEMKTNEDQTAFYKVEIAKGLRHFAAAMRIAPPPDAETKAIILREVESWVRRMAAMEQGLKFYRFHAIKS